MLRSFVFLFVLVLSLPALSSYEILKRANKLVVSSNKSNQFRAYNDYKNLYIRALMKDDKKLLKSSLSGIVKSGTKLHIDISQYKKEYLALKKVQQKRKRTFHKPQKKPQVKSSNQFKSITWKNGNLVLRFSKKLGKNSLNYFSKYDVKKKRYQYIFDIHASLRYAKTLRRNKIDKIKIFQQNLHTMRLLIENKKSLKINFKKTSTTIIITIKTKVVKKRKVKVVSQSSIAPQRLDRNKIIVVDAGHGGKDPGAIGYRKYREKVVVLSIARDLASILKKRGFKVYMTRSKDHFVKLRNRTKYANRKHADIFISIHANAVSPRNALKAEGLETYFLSKSRSSRAKRVAAKENKVDLSEMDYYGKESFLSTLNSHNIVAANKLAIDLQRGALASLNKRYKHVKDAGVREGPFWVLVGAQMPAVLVEVGFITNPTEAKRLVSTKYQKQLATGLANGVERYFINN